MRLDFSLFDSPYMVAIMEKIPAIVDGDIIGSKYCIVGIGIDNYAYLIEWRGFKPMRDALKDFKIWLAGLL